MVTKNVHRINPRKLHVRSDEDTVTLYQVFSTRTAKSAVAQQSMLGARGFSVHNIMWFKTSFTQALYLADYQKLTGKAARILALRVTYTGLEEILARAALSHSYDVTSSGEVNILAPVQIIWDNARLPQGNKTNRQKSMRIGVSGAPLVQLVSRDILSIEDVTEKARKLTVIVSNNKQSDAQRFVRSFDERELPIDNHDIEWRLGML